MPDSEDLSMEDLAESKLRTRINALAMFLFFFASAVLPRRWKLFAPLVLLPVRLERSSAADRFHLVSPSEPPSPNLSLQAKMDGE